MYFGTGSKSLCKMRQREGNGAGITASFEFEPKDNETEGEFRLYMSRIRASSAGVCGSGGEWGWEICHAGIRICRWSGRAGDRRTRKTWNRRTLAETPNLKEYLIIDWRKKRFMIEFSWGNRLVFELFVVIKLPRKLLDQLLFFMFFVSHLSLSCKKRKIFFEIGIDK